MGASCVGPTVSYDASGPLHTVCSVVPDLDGPSCGRGPTVEGCGSSCSVLLAEWDATVLPNTATPQDDDNKLDVDPNDPRWSIPSEPEKSLPYSMTLVPNSFTVTLLKEPEVGLNGGAVGLCVDPSDTQTLLVTSVAGGAAQCWNDMVRKDLRVRPFDRIIEVNRCSGSARLLVTRLRLDIALKMLVVRPVEVAMTVRIESLGLNALGLPVTNNTPESMYLRVLAVRPGPIADWNAVHAGGMVVKKNDLVVQVNGVRGTALELYTRISNSATLELIFLVYDEPAASRLPGTNPALCRMPRVHSMTPLLTPIDEKAAETTGGNADSDTEVTKDYL
eukprot:NODE_11334_length_1293_cov_8.064322.p1 GENE.NODE_11334_length_1293_cov_8.064322~~NODE_11334_length_1293_cov_8.064322.p1  ORF type:complete len:334 (-),score=89.05 NODE_11334_length_1293_cov_8.064322:156-1157(-)